MSLKSGFLQRYSRKFMSEGWKSIWCVLHSDGTFAWYKHQSDRSPKGQVNMKNVANFFAVGAYATRIPNSPRVTDQQANLLIAIPDRPNRDAYVEFFMANSQQELDEWMQKIVSTLPQQGAAPPPPAAATYPQQQGTAPYPTSSGGPPPIGFGGMPQPGSAPYPPPAGYPQQGGYPYPPQQGYPPPGGAYPPQQGYPQQAYPQQGYPQQGYAGAYPAAGAAMAGAAYGAQPTHQVVYVNGKPKKKKNKLGMSNTTTGLIGGAAAGYMLGRMTGGGFGGWGHGFGGGWGSWSSLSSFGSCGSFGSFGSFD